MGILVLAVLTFPVANWLRRRAGEEHGTTCARALYARRTQDREAGRGSKGASEVATGPPRGTGGTSSGDESSDKPKLARIWGSSPS